jgi:endonuclease G
MMMSRKYTYLILLVIITVLLYFLENYIDQYQEDYPKDIITSYRMDKTILPESTTDAIIEHTYYTLSYSEEHEQAEWVAYELLRGHLSDNDFERPYYVEDRMVKSRSADWRNYKGSGYDKGHLCPAGDRRFSYGAYQETFLTSNISPQVHEFNAGIWNRLEQKTRYWANKMDGVYVITGGVLMDREKYIGDERVTVPEAFYKIVLKRKGNDYSTIAFLIPNQASGESIYNFVTTIDSIEIKTGIDFFPQIEDSIESSLESAIDLSVWIEN